MPLTDDLQSGPELGSEFLWPIRVYFCEQCSLVQTLHDVDTSDYYRDYQYSVAQSQFASDFMRTLAKKIWFNYRLNAGDAIIEVGSSDGAQLACFQELGARAFGFEPSAPLVDIARGRGIPVIARLFDEQALQAIPPDLLPAQVVLLTYTFDHLADPLPFLNMVSRVLDPERGILVIEVHDFDKIAERREFCLFAHEHAAYYTLSTIQSVLRRAGFELVDIDLVPEAERRGNSLLVAAALSGSPLAAASSIHPEGLGWRREDFLAFGQAVRDSLQRVREFISSKRQRGVRLAGYGAGGRGVMTLAATAQSGDFAYVCDKNAAFHGRYTPRAHVLVDSPARLLTEPVDEVVVFSFGYMREIYKDLGEFRSRGGLLVSLLDLL
jgi:SAM-dependent methyltransferase